MSNPARNLLIPHDPRAFRSAFLYVGQGDATLHIIPDGSGAFIFVLLDCNRDALRNGTDLVALLEDLLPQDAEGRPVLNYFINTHPHNDHICGLDVLRERIRVLNVWHTGFIPGKDHEQAFKHFNALIEQVKSEGGTVWEYQGTRGQTSIGTVSVDILSPAQHVKDEIDELEGDARRARIHEYCGVLRFGYGQPARFVMQPGDADKCAWQNHILGDSEYHSERVPADVLNAVHHGSRTFFKSSPDDADVYERPLEVMEPTWVVVSSPTQSESPHGHPHDDAMEVYRKHVPADRIYLLGERREAVLYDIYEDGQQYFRTDNGELTRAYPLDGGDGGDGKMGAPYVHTRVDSGRPMGAV